MRYRKNEKKIGKEITRNANIWGGFKVKRNNRVKEGYFKMLKRTNNNNKPTHNKKIVVK